MSLPGERPNPAFAGVDRMPLLCDCVGLWTSGKHHHADGGLQLLETLMYKLQIFTITQRQISSGVAWLCLCLSLALASPAHSRAGHVVQRQQFRALVGPVLCSVSCTESETEDWQFLCKPRQ